MKHFTQREQIIIRRIIENAALDTYVLTNAFNDLLYGRGVAFDSQKGFLQFDPSKYSNVSSILRVEREFIETALLIQYLINNQYIYLIVDSQETPLPWIGDEISNPIGKQIPRDVAEIFINSFVRIVVLNKLFDVDNNFLTYEGQQLSLAANSLSVANIQANYAKVTTYISIGTCVIAVLTLFATLFIPCCSCSKYNNTTAYNADTLSYAAEIDDIEVIKSQFEKTNAYLLQIIEQNNNLTNHFKISPKIQINSSKKSAPQQKASQKVKCLDMIPVYKIDTINCDGETYWVLPCPPKKTSTIDEKEK